MLLCVRATLPHPLGPDSDVMFVDGGNVFDPFNAVLNFGYAILQGEVRKAVNSVGLEPSLAFLHDFSDYQTESLVYDLQEPFRWLVDLSVIHAFESGMLDLHDFFFTGDDYRYRFEPEAKVRFIGVLRERFNSGVKYRRRVLKWDTVIEQKTLELSRFLVGKFSRLDFIEPSPTLERFDNMEFRERIKVLTCEEAKKAGIDKSTLYTLRQHARKESPFKLYRKTLEKLQSARR
jgi:CRISPR-associated protein Cas1